MKYLLTLTAICLLLASCSKKHNDDPDPIETQARRTVIVYISGDNNLSSYVTSDFNEMLKGSASMPSDGNLVLYIDRKGSEAPCIVSIKNEKADTISVATENTYASDPTVMIDVLSSIMDEYPADDYGLVLWGHANGWLIANDTIQSRSYGIDNGGDSGYWINIPTIANVLGTLPNKFKFILADCCCFQSVEVAYELRNVTDYIIGSPAEIPAQGAPYDVVVPAFFDYTDTFYKSIVDAYETQTVNGSKEPLSVIKTSEMETFAEATAPLLQIVAEKGGIPETNDVVYYFSYSPYSVRCRIHYDIQDVFMKYVDDDNLYNNWKSELDRVVVYKYLACPWITEDFVNFYGFDLSDDNYSGVSIFIPSSYYPDVFNIGSYTFNKDGIKKMQWYYATGMDEYFSNI